MFAQLLPAGYPILNNDAKSFIVRIWIESQPENGGKPAWRGVIEHVGSNDRMHFHTLNKVSRFISEKSGLRKRPTLTEWWRDSLTWIRDELRKRLPNLQ